MRCVIANIARLHKSTFIKNVWKNIAPDLKNWDLPHCLGAIVGNQLIQCPLGIITEVIVTCDAHYCLTVIDAGEYESDNDCGVLFNFKMGTKFENYRFDTPRLEALHGLDERNFFLSNSG